MNGLCWLQELTFECFDRDAEMEVASWRYSTPHEGGGISMKHPSNRAERRHERRRIIAYRRCIRAKSQGNPRPEQIWAQYSKWNGNCGSMSCHAGKYFGARRKRREALKQATKDEE